MHIPRQSYEVVIRARINVPNDKRVHDSVASTLTSELNGTQWLEVDQEGEEFDFTLDVQSVRILAIGVSAR